jgi:hypothetical protein
MRARGSLCKLGAWVSLPDSAACQGCQGIHSRLLMKILERSGLGRAEGIVATHLQLWDVRSIPFVYVSWSEILAPTPRMTRLTKITVHTTSEDPLCEAWLQEPYSNCWFDLKLVLMDCTTRKQTNIIGLCEYREDTLTYFVSLCKL